MSAGSVHLRICIEPGATMLRIPCPWCGERDETEFRYRGAAGHTRPAPEAGLEGFIDFVYRRENPCGWHLEWWLHVGGCRRLLKVARHTVTHQIGAVGAAHESLQLPEAAGRG